MRKIMLIFLIVAVLTCLSVSYVAAGEFFLKQTLFEGDSKNYDVGTGTYKVTLKGVFDSQLKAQFDVNGEESKALGEDESYKFSDGTVIQVREVLPQESGDGKDLVQFNLFPSEKQDVTNAPATSTTVSVAQEPSLEPAPEPEKADAQPAKTVTAAPAREAKIDITRKRPTNSWWESMISWLKNLFS